jgi:hypothetical protein
MLTGLIGLLPLSSGTSNSIALVISADVQQATRQTAHALVSGTCHKALLIMTAACTMRQPLFQPHAH